MYFEMSGQASFYVPYQGASVLSTYLFTHEIPEKRLEDVEVACECLYMFQEIPSIPLHRIIEFRIDLMPDIASVSKAPYRMTPGLLYVMKKQLAELGEKG